jgi:hypothetical protein
VVEDLEGETLTRVSNYDDLVLLEPNSVREGIYPVSTLLVSTSEVSPTVLFSQMNIDPSIRPSIITLSFSLCPARTNHLPISKQLPITNPIRYHTVVVLQIQITDAPKMPVYEENSFEANKQTHSMDAKFLISSIRY